MPLVSLIFLVLFNFASSQIQVPFIGKYNDTLEADIRIYFNISIGSPEQQVELILEDDDYWWPEDLYVLDKETFGFGFNSKKSSSFKKVSNSTFMGGHGINGTDNFKINGTVLKGKPLQIIYEGTYISPPAGIMGLDRYNEFGSLHICKNKKMDCTTFLESVLVDYKDSVLVLAFDKIKSDSNESFTGQLVLGEKPKHLCSDNWAFMPEVKNPDPNKVLWSFRIDSISFGKYSYKDSRSSYANFGLSSTEVLMPSKIYLSLMKSIGGTLHGVGDTIPCDTKTDIVYVLGGKELRIKPKVYIRKTKDGKCQFNGRSVTGDHNYWIPFTALSQHCLLMDYRNYGVGFTERV